MLIIINIINNKDLWVCDRKSENERTKNNLIKKHPKVGVQLLGCSSSRTWVFSLVY